MRGVHVRLRSKMAQRMRATPALHGADPASCQRQERRCHGSGAAVVPKAAAGVMKARRSTAHRTASCVGAMGFTHAQVRRCGRLQGNRAIPFICRCGYDGNVARDTIQAWSGPKNRSTPMWENRSDLAEIVRCKFGRKYDESEARNNTLALPELPPILSQLIDNVVATSIFIYTVFSR